MKDLQYLSRSDCSSSTLVQNGIDPSDLPPSFYQSTDCSMQSNLSSVMSTPAPELKHASPEQQSSSNSLTERFASRVQSVRSHSTRRKAKEQVKVGISVGRIPGMPSTPYTSSFINHF